MKKTKNKKGGKNPFKSYMRAKKPLRIAPEPLPDEPGEDAEEEGTDCYSFVDEPGINVKPKVLQNF